MESKWWGRFQWFILRLFEFKKTAYPLSMMGTKIVTLALIGIAGVSINVIIRTDNDVDIPLTEIFSVPSIFPSIACLLGLVIGGGMILHELKSVARTIARLFITGMPGASTDFPQGLLTRTEERVSRELLHFPTSGETEQARKEHIDNFNAEVHADVFNRFVLHKECKKVFIGGLARVPFLVAYGSCLRNQSAHVFYFDKFHCGGKWQLLSAKNSMIDFATNDEGVVPNEDGQIGLAIAFSTDVIKEQLPVQLREHTKILRPNCDTDRNLIKNQENIEQLGAQVKRAIDRFSATQAKEIHLFLSVQSPFAIEIGRQFQEGTYKPWVVHNFDASSGQYNWAIRLTKSGLEPF